MKKLIFLFALLLMIPAMLFSQEVPDIPENVGVILENPLRFLGQLAGVIGLTIFTVQAIKLLFKTEAKWAKIVLSVVIGVFWSAFTNLINFGLFADSPWLDTVIWGAVGIGPVAGAVYDIPTARTLVNLLLAIISFKKPE